MQRQRKEHRSQDNTMLDDPGKHKYVKLEMVSPWDDPKNEISSYTKEIYN